MNYLLCISFWFKSDEPIVIIGKFTINKFRQILAFEEGFYILKTQQTKKVTKYGKAVAQ